MLYAKCFRALRGVRFCPKSPIRVFFAVAVLHCKLVRGVLFFHRVLSSLSARYRANQALHLTPIPRTDRADRLSFGVLLWAIPERGE